MNATTDPAAIWLEPAELTPHPRNPRKNQPVDEVAESIAEFGFASPIVARAACRTIIAGHTRLKAAHKLGLTTVPVRLLDVTKEQALRLMLSDNRLAMLAAWDDEGLAALLRELDDDVALPGFDDGELQALSQDQPSDSEAQGINLVDTFGVPTFSVLDAKQGYWRERKRQWIRWLGDSSEGRAQELVNFSDSISVQNTSNTSVFDPVLTELSLRWFCPQGGLVLDPFAGGSVRGLVSARLGRKYFGIDIRAEQIKANEARWAEIQQSKAKGTQETAVDSPITNKAQLYSVSNPDELTPVERHGNFWVKRDDCFVYNGTNGNKVRSTLKIALKENAVGLVGVGSRHSPQITRVARVAQALGIPCRVHVPKGKDTPEIVDCRESGAEVIRHPAGYNSVIKKRAADDAEKSGWTLVPFAGESKITIACVQAQFSNVAKMLSKVNRIVVPVGSGMTLAGVLQALKKAGDTETPVLGVRVGGNPEPFLDRWAPAGWRDRVQIVKSKLKYSQHAPLVQLESVTLDPVYEAKCIPFLQLNDLLWVVGIRDNSPSAKLINDELMLPPIWMQGDSRNLNQILPSNYKADFLLTCPPYFDLEVYSDDPADISNAPNGYQGFLTAYQDLLHKACERLRENRFAVIVIGDVRDKKGFYRGLVSDTIKIVTDCGLHLYNDAVLAISIASASMRAPRYFQSSRKLANVHQRVLVFYKGERLKLPEQLEPFEAQDFASKFNLPTD